MRTRKRVWIDFTYYEPGNADNPIAAFFEKDSDMMPYIRETDAKKEIAKWRLSSETWKKAFNDLTRSIQRGNKK